MLPDDFCTRWKIEEWTLQETFRSKKNDVRKIEIVTAQGKKSVVLKKFTSADGFQKESQLYRQMLARNAPVPRVYFAGNQVIITEFIDGPVLVDCLYQNSEHLIRVLRHALQRIYDALRNVQRDMILGDMNFRNFIWDQRTDMVFRLDFESVTDGLIAEDIGKLCAFCLTYDPPFTRSKMRISRRLFYHLADHLDLSCEHTSNSLLNELREIEDRRQMPVPKQVRSSVRSW